MRKIFLARTALAAAMLTLSARAEVKLSSLFSDNMVLQRGKPIAVWGWAGEGEKVTVTFRGESKTATAKDGQWLLHLSPSQAGGPFEFKVKGENEINLENVLVGEVWICSGQSNMEWPMRITFEPAAAIANSENKNLRLFTVPKLRADAPTNNVRGTWLPTQPGSVTNFSAVAYYFGRDLQKALNVPVGVIHTSWGGSPAEVWVREAILAENPLYKSEILDNYARQKARYDEELPKWEEEKAALEKEGKKITRNRPGLGWKPAELYNGMIAPLLPYSIQGAIWYQGESNAGRAYEYRTLFPDMITNWRHDFGQGDFPFLLVQLAPWDRNKKRELSVIAQDPVQSDWAELREAQWLATKVLPNVGMAVITDYGDKDDIHPAKKEPVGARLALAARAIAYGEKIVHSGPEYRGLRLEGSQAVISFNHVGQGLAARGGELTGFAIAGADRKFVPAQAKIVGDTVVVTSPDVPKPVAVRFGWADFPIVNLFNKDGLPATPFRTDNFPMLTGPRLVVKN